MPTDSTHIPSAQQELAALTKQRILLAVRKLFDESRLNDISIQAIAARANVSVQSIYRHFESRDGLIDQFLDEMAVLVENYPLEAAPGNIYSIVKNLLHYYQENAPLLLRLQMQTDDSPKLSACWAVVQRSHLAWVRANFSVFLESLSRQRQLEMENQLMWLTDVSCWRVYIQELGRSSVEIEQGMVHVLRAVLQSYR